MNATRLPHGFEAKVSEGRWLVSVPAYAVVEIRDGLAWKKIHDGRRWGGHGIVPTFPRIGLSLPVTARLRIGAQGRRWRIALPRVKDAAPFDARTVWTRSRSFRKSVLGHVAVFGSLWFASQWQNLVPTKLLSPKVENAIADKQATPAGGAVAAQIPFEGISFGRFFEVAKTSAKGLTSLVAGLGNLDFGRGSLANAAPGAIALPALEPAVTALAEGVKARDRAPKAKPSAAPIAAADETQLRAHFRSLQEPLRRVYSRVLSEDPSFQATVRIEATVRANGTLQLSNFSATGSHSTASLARLRSMVSELLEGTFVGKEFAGLTLRGENVFAR